MKVAFLSLVAFMLAKDKSILASVLLVSPSSLVRISYAWKFSNNLLLAFSHPYTVTKKLKKKYHTSNINKIKEWNANKIKYM